MQKDNKLYKKKTKIRNLGIYLAKIRYNKVYNNNVIGQDATTFC